MWHVCVCVRTREHMYLALELLGQVGKMTNDLPWDGDQY